VRTAIFHARDGDLTQCASAAGPVSLKSIVFPEEKKFPLTQRDWVVKLMCVTRCSYVAKLEKYPTGEQVVSAEGDLEPNTPTDVLLRLSGQTLALDQDYRILVRAWQWRRIGTTVLRPGPLFSAEAPPPPAPPTPPVPAPLVGG
jgi:hypothetical protein